MRYDSFLATILGFDDRRQLRLPKELRILTWNYDTQIEKAFYGFCGNSDHVINEITLNMHIYRINGHCGTAQTGHIGQYFKAVWNTKHLEAWENGIRLYKEYMSSPSVNEAAIYFAWEEPTRKRITYLNLDLNEP